MRGQCFIPSFKNDDPNYRYKMPVMQLKQESRLNGVKTNISNLPDVARALRVPESSILKWFCVELGANSEGTTIVKGQHTAEDMAKHLDKFIMKYVCCKKCKLPEITHEVENKKKLVGVCRSCGKTDSKMDTIHKAGKSLLKDIPSYYQANPEFGKKSLIPPNEAEKTSAQQASDSGKAKKGKKKAKEGENAEIERQEEETKAKVESMIANNEEINALDSVNVSIDDPIILNACEEMRQFVASMEQDGAIDPDGILREVRQIQLSLRVTPEFKMYICMCGIFSYQRNIVKHWDTFEPVFTTLVEQSEGLGEKHLLQTLIQYFVNRYPEHQKFAASLCSKLYENSMISQDVFTQWHSGDKKGKLDVSCKLYDRKAERTLKPLLDEFITWLTSTEYDEEADYGEEEATGEGSQPAEEEKKEEPEETEQQQKQRLLIEKQKREQEERVAAAKAAAAQAKIDNENAKAAQEVAAGEDLEGVKATNVAKIEVEEDFDVDDI